jgi:hypothetical protein
MPVKRYDGTNWVTVAGDGAQGPTGPAGASATTVVTTKGDLLTYSTTAARLATGTNGQVLTADSAETTGLKWATPTSGGITLLSTTTLSGSTTTISSINQGYTNLIVTYHGLNLSSGGVDVTVNPNVATAASYIYFHSRSGTVFNTNSSTIGNNQAQWYGGDTNNGHALFIYDYSSSDKYKAFHFSGILNSSNNGAMTAVSGAGAFNYIDAITSIRFAVSSGSFNAGTVKIYGVK